MALSGWVTLISDLSTSKCDHWSPSVLQFFSSRLALGAHHLLPVYHDGRLAGRVSGEHHSMQRVAKGVDTCIMGLHPDAHQCIMPIRCIIRKKNAAARLNAKWAPAFA